MTKKEEKRNGGFVKLFKKQFDHPIWDNGKYDLGKAWLELWSLAVHKEMDFPVRKDNKIIDWVKLLPGQQYIFPETQAKRWGWSYNKVNGFLNRLARKDTFKTEDGPMISIDYPVKIPMGKKVVRWGLRVTIMNWGFYQISNGEKSTKKNKTLNQEVLNTFEYWNERKTVVHRSIKKYKGNINSALNDYSEAEIREAIRLYAIVYHENVYWWKANWTIKEFLTRGLEKFQPACNPLESYKKRGKEQFEKQKPKLSYMQ